ncbi:PP2C family protein-serine/threonine phosphatase [Piscinibacter sp.]|uniref:PP2C family protein-serine/threonine phosphatase n=1 Tax=Piscinibacter sp. TaxID=1903157 RepID=UPI002F424937
MSIEPGPFRWTSASRSHAGLIREVNEDACLEQPERGLWAVADGMGGHALGEFASRLAVRSLVDLRPPQSLEQYVADVRERLQSANRRLRAEAAQRDVPVIGTTIVALVASGRHCACLWAGDSRIYLYRAGRLKLLTRDHSQVEEVRSRRHSSADETLHRPPANLITRALGAADTLEIDGSTVEVVDGDIFLLCSDGLSNEVSELAIEQALLPGNCRQACQALLDLALHGGGRDNITAVVVRAEDLDSPDRTAMHPVL